LKQQYNIIGAAAEVAGWDLEKQQEQTQAQAQAHARGSETPAITEMTASASAHAHANAKAGDDDVGPMSATDLRYMQLDEILELTVLNEEIRMCLPSLEAQALRLESQIYAVDRATTTALATQKVRV